MTAYTIFMAQVSHKKNSSLEHAPAVNVSDKTIRYEDIWSVFTVKNFLVFL